MFTVHMNDGRTKQFDNKDMADAYATAISGRVEEKVAKKKPAPKKDTTTKTATKAKKTEEKEA